jgi:hypothetical protein
MQALAERFGNDKVVLAGLLSADEVHVNSSLEGYNFVGKVCLVGPFMFQTAIMCYLPHA